MHLGQRVAHLRRRRGISQLTLAGRMGRSESWISKVERGERRIDRVSVIEQLATVLDVDPGTLLGWGEGSRGDEPCEAERSGNRLALAGCSRMVVHAFLDAGHCRRALELASAAAGALQPELDGSPALESVYGALLLKGAVAAARGGDRAITRELLAQAEGAAERLGGDHNHCWTAFGPANVVLHEVATAVELGDGGEAVTGALAIDPLRLPALERRAQRQIDLARGHGLWSRDAEALAALLEAESLAPEEVRRQRAVRTLVGELLRRQRRGAGGELRALAGRLAEPG